MSFASKRQRDEVNAEQLKKSRAGDMAPQEYTTSDEWPIYSHPEGGIVKITPWGSLRQFTNENGDNITKFEDVGFEDITFQKNIPQQTDYTPSTPQSLYNSQQYHQNGRNAGLKLSPSDEAELYVVDGYSESGTGAMTPSPNQPPQNQFEQEHENYFGMGDPEEFDTTESFQNGKNDDAEMSY